MSIAGILTSTLFEAGALLNQPNGSSNNFSSTLQQLGQDLQAGNLSQAQQDFATLTQNTPSTQPTSNPFDQGLNALGQALQSGNLTAAQQAYATLQQDVEGGAGRIERHHHDHHASNQGNNSQQQNSLAQEFSTLGQSLQSGNLTAAQQAYSALQQDLQQYFPNANFNSASASSAVGSSPSASLNIRA